MTHQGSHLRRKKQCPLWLPDGSLQSRFDDVRSVFKEYNYRLAVAISCVIEFFDNGLLKNSINRKNKLMKT